MDLSKPGRKAWFDKLKSTLKFQGFENFKRDVSLLCKSVKSKIFIILIYVDDIIITGNNSKGIKVVPENLNKTFALKDLGDLNFFFGIQFIRNQDTILLSQTKYVQELLAKTEITDYKGMEALFSTSEKLKKDDGLNFMILHSTEVSQEVCNMQYLQGMRLLS